MPVPKRKRSRARRDSRFANKGIKIKSITACSNCKDAIAPHQACKACGYYKGEKVLRTKNDRLVGRAHTRQAAMAQKAKRTAANENSASAE